MSPGFRQDKGRRIDPDYDYRPPLRRSSGRRIYFERLVAGRANLSDNSAVTKAAARDPYPEFNHQLRALRARLDRDDRETIGESLRRIGFKTDEAELEAVILFGRALGASEQNADVTAINFSCASPIYEECRQTGPYRIPHLRITPVSKCVVPRSAEGKTHPRYPERRVAGAHVDYVCDGGKASLAEHIDYIVRRDAVDSPPWLIDIIDAESDRRLENNLAIVSNIPGGRARQRSLFEAAERCERAAKGGKLIASTKDADAWIQAAVDVGAPDWVVSAGLQMIKEKLKLERGAKLGRPLQHKDVELCSVSLEEAYDRLTWCDTVPELADALPRWKAGPCGRVATRFVAELPADSTAYERHEILKRLGDALAAEGWMYVGAIHRPDPHNKRFNFHLHIDAYDRPCEWLEEHGCWDFEYKVKKRNGDISFPKRKPKIASATRDPNGGSHVRYGEQCFEERRATFIDIVNSVMGRQVYVSGTYAENGIDLRPLKHLGNEVIVLEKAGHLTELGSANARIFFDDKLRAVACAAEEKIGRLREEKADYLLFEPDEAPRIHAAFAMLEAAIMRGARRSAVEIVRQMASSRAETVLNYSDDPRAKAAAAEHLRAIMRLGPSAQELKASTARAAQLESDAHDLLAAAARSERARNLGLFVRHRDQLVECGVSSGNYAHLQAGRLAAWVRKHGGDPAKVAVTDGAVRLGNATPKAIVTLFAKVGAHPEVQHALAEAEHVHSSAALSPEILSVGAAQETDASPAQLSEAACLEPDRADSSGSGSAVPAAVGRGAEAPARVGDHWTASAPTPGVSDQNDPTNARPFALTPDVATAADPPSAAGAAVASSSGSRGEGIEGSPPVAPTTAKAPSVPNPAGEIDNLRRSGKPAHSGSNSAVPEAPAGGPSKSGGVLGQARSLPRPDQGMSANVSITKGPASPAEQARPGHRQLVSAKAFPVANGDQADRANLSETAKGTASTAGAAASSLSACPDKGIEGAAALAPAPAPAAPSSSSRQKAHIDSAGGAGALADLSSAPAVPRPPAGGNPRSGGLLEQARSLQRPDSKVRAKGPAPKETEPPTEEARAGERRMVWSKGPRTADGDRGDGPDLARIVDRSKAAGL